MSEAAHASRGLVRRWTFGILLAVLLIVPSSTVWMVVRLYDDVPYGDQIDFFARDKLDEGLSPARLFAFHNEHQTVFTKLVIYLDYVWLHGSNLLPCVITGLLLLGVWALYCMVLKHSAGALSRQQLTVCCGLLLTLYCNGRMLWTITFPVLEQHPWTSFLAVLGFYWFCRLALACTPQNPRGEERRPRQTLLLLLAATLAAAALVSAGGVLAGPAMLVVTAALLLWSRAFPKSAVWKLGLAIFCLSAVIVAVYFGAYLASHGPAERNNRASFGAIVRFAFVFVGGAFFRDGRWPITHHANLPALYSVAALFWALLVWLTVQLFRRRDKITAFELFHSCVLVFVVITAASGGVFRGQLGSLEGINRKYPSIELLAWLSAISLLFYYRPYLLFGNRQRSWLRPLVICTGAVLLLVPGDQVEFRVWRAWQAQIRQTACTVASGVYSAELLRRLYYNGKIGYDTSQQFVRAGTYCYRRMPSPGYKLGERFHVIGAPRSDMLVADITPVQEVFGREGFTAEGTTTETSGEFPALVITDSDDRVEGYGMVMDGSLSDGSSRAVRGWFAAVRKPPGFAGAGTFRIYSIRGESATLAGTLSAGPPSSSGSRFEQRQNRVLAGQHSRGRPSLGNSGARHRAEQPASRPSIAASKP